MLFRSQTKSLAGQNIKLRIYTENIERTNLICKKWTTKDNKVVDISHYSISSLEKAHDSLVISAPSFIVDGYEKSINFDFAVNCRTINGEIGRASCRERV